MCKSVVMNLEMQKPSLNSESIPTLIIVSNNSWTGKFRASRNTMQRFSGVCDVAVLWIADWKLCCVFPMSWGCHTSGYGVTAFNVMFLFEIYLK